MNEIGKHEPECNDRCTGDSHFLSGTASCDVCDTGFAMEQHDCPKRTLPQLQDTKPLLRLADGAILNIKDSSWTESYGCDTCGGAWVAKDLTIETTQGSWQYDFNDEGDDSITVEFIMGTILPNLAEIQSMTVAGFIDWFTARLRSQAKEKRETFKVVKS